MITLFHKTSAKWMAAALTMAFLLAGCSSLIGPNRSSGSSDSPSSSQASSGAPQSPSSGNPDSAVSSPASSQPASSTSGQSGDTLLSDMMKSAKVGKAINCSYAANETSNIDTIADKWGKADSTEWIPTAKGFYTTYSKYNIVFGSNKGGAIFEVRSFDSRLKEISLSAAKAAFGKPAYDVTSNHQEIIGYVATADYKLLLVFPQPTSSDSDPHLDHYSVLNPAETVNSMSGDPGRQW